MEMLDPKSPDAAAAPVHPFAFYGSVLLSALASSAVLTLLAATGTAWAGTDQPLLVPEEVCSTAG